MDDNDLKEDSKFEENYESITDYLMIIKGKYI
jgi:hypothetical protein